MSRGFYTSKSGRVTLNGSDAGNVLTHIVNAFGICGWVSVLGCSVDPVFCEACFFLDAFAACFVCCLHTLGLSYQPKDLELLSWVAIPCHRPEVKLLPKNVRAIAEKHDLTTLAEQMYHFWHDEYK